MQDDRAGQREGARDRGAHRQGPVLDDRHRTPFRGDRFDYEVKYTVETKRFDELVPKLRKSLDSFREMPGEVPVAGCQGGLIMQSALSIRSDAGIMPSLSSALPFVTEHTMALNLTARRLAMCIGIFTAGHSAFHEAARGSPIAYQYSGVITQADSSTGIALGTPFSGTFSYDPEKPSSGLAIEGFSQLNFGVSTTSPGSVADGSGINLQIGGQTILANPGGLAIATYEIDIPGDQDRLGPSGSHDPYTTVVISNSQVVDTKPSPGRLNLTNPAVGLGNSINPLSLANFPDAQLSVTLASASGTQTLYTGTIDSLVETAVPEPTVASLLCLAAIGWLVRNRHERKVSARRESQA